MLMLHRKKEPKVMNKEITVQHDTYKFHINPNNYYRSPISMLIGWYIDHKGYLQAIYRDSVYGKWLEAHLPEDEPTIKK